MTFGHPYLLLTLLLVPIVAGLYLLGRRRRMRYAIAYTNVDVLAAVVEGRSWRRVVPPALFLVALAALCVGLARPHVRSLVAEDHATVILVIDASRSMQSTDVKPSRLAAAEEAVQTFLDRAPKQLQVALIVFAGDVQVAAPPTTDHNLVRESLRIVEDYPGYTGTAIGDALQVAVQLGRQAIQGGRTSGTTIAYRSAAAPLPPDRTSPVSILFLSDGRQTTGALTPMEGADLARNAGFPVYTVALGTNGGSLPGFGNSSGGGFGLSSPAYSLAPDRVTLRAIALRTGGTYFPARSAAAAHAAYAKLGSRLGRRPAHEEITYVFLAIAAGLLVLAGAASTLWAPRLP
jgi:Ca-activated chloride channel family protein